MKLRSTTGIFGAMLIVYGLALLPALFFDGYLDSPVGVLLLLPYLSVYLFHTAGVPGLLVNEGACGWGWCAPTLLGWAFVAVFWSGLTWLLASLIAKLIRISAGRKRSGE